MLPHLTTLILVPALAWVVVSDLLYRRISNRLVLALLLAWLVLAGWMTAQGEGMAMLAGVPAALSALIAGYLLFAMRWMGAGDAKLMAVLCLWLGGQAFAFLMVTALAGGVLALAITPLRMAERALAHSLMRLGALLPRSAIPLPQALGSEPAAGLPYGLAIAAGAAFVLWGS